MSIAPYTTRCPERAPSSDLGYCQCVQAHDHRPPHRCPHNSVWWPVTH